MTRQQNEELLSKYISYLLLNYGFVEANGLLHGKMGGVLFFNLYARTTGEQYYRQYAEELFDRITETISIASAVDFGWGLAGIGWGVEYLIQNGLQDGNTDDLLEEIDRVIMIRDPLRLTDMSFDTGLEGILLYVTARMSSFERHHSFSPFDRAYLDTLSEAVHRNRNQIPKELAAQYQNLRAGCGPYGGPMAFPNKVFGTLPPSCSAPDTLPIGIRNGLTGMVLKAILA